MTNPWETNSQGYANVPGLHAPDTGNAVPDGAGYPAMPNSYGLGAQVSNTPQDPGIAGGGKPVTVTVPDTASRGFNPWSLTGESNARGQ